MKIIASQFKAILKEVKDFFKDYFSKQLTNDNKKKFNYENFWTCNVITDKVFLVLKALSKNVKRGFISFYL